MILYDNRSLWRQILQREGSIVNEPKRIVTAFVLALVTVLFRYLEDVESSLAMNVSNFYAVSAFVSIVAFAIVFRTSLAWQKYWESLGEVEKMYSKWTDVFTQYTVFARTTMEAGLAKGDQTGKAKAERVQETYNNVHKHFSLLSAMAVDRLSHGDLEVMGRRSVESSWSEQITTRAKIGSIKNETAPERDLPNFTTREESGKQGSSMRATRSDASWTNKYTVEELPSAAETKALRFAEDRVNVVTVWILSGLAHSTHDLDIPPPIQSRMYQELSNASLAFLNCVKIADTPFPFAYSQVLAYLLIVFCGLVPLISAAATKSYVISPIVSYLLFQSFWTIYEGALDLEAPFGKDLNDIPLSDFHRRFCKSLVEVHVALDVVHGGKVDGVTSSAGTLFGRETSLDDLATLSATSSAQNSQHSKSPTEAFVAKDAAPICATQAAAATPLTTTSDWLRACAATAFTPELNGHFAAKRVKDGLQEIQGSSRGSNLGQTQGSGGLATEVIDRHLWEIGERMERHLAIIAREIDAIAQRDKAIREEERRMLRGEPNGDGSEYYI